MSNPKNIINLNTNTFPLEIIDLADEDNKKLYPNFPSDEILVGPNKHCLPKRFKQLCPIFYNFPIRPDDVWLFGVPRSGTTIMQEMIWLLCNDLNYKKAAETVINLRVHFLEEEIVNENIINNIKDEEVKSLAETISIPAWKRLMETNERRFIKTHLPINLINPDVLESGCKVISIIRNSKDVLMSNFYLGIALKYLETDKTFQEHFPDILKDPRLPNNILKPLKEISKHRHNSNLLILFYEDLILDMRNHIKIIANFLEKSLNDDELDKLENHFKFENFQRNNSVNNSHLRKMGAMRNEENNFIRKGKVNNWKECFTKEMNNEFDKLYEETMKGCDLRFN